MATITRPTGELRFVLRRSDTDAVGGHVSYGRILQQRWITHEVGDSNLLSWPQEDAHYEWRDVPLVKEEPEDGPAQERVRSTRE